MTATAAHAPRERVLLVGAGYAGRRFLAALAHLEASGAPLELAGVCDRNPERLAGRLEPCYEDVERALDEAAPSVVCIAVNEVAHAEVFAALRDRPRLLVLSEKPLACSTSEGERAALSLWEHGFSMNMVERFSPMVTECRDWIAAEGPLEVIRVEAFWGKHRIGDARPTIGVLSELVHPIDLAQFLFVPGPLEVVRAQGTASDFSPHSAATLDSVDALWCAGRAPVVVHSSFVWPRRVRTMTAVVRSAAGRTFRVELDFDNPHWDCDRLEIAEIAASGRTTVEHTSVVDVERTPPALAGVAKVASYVDSSVRAWRGGGGDPALVDLRAALELQQSLDEVAAALGEVVAAPGYRERVPA